MRDGEQKNLPLIFRLNILSYPVLTINSSPKVKSEGEVTQKTGDRQILYSCILCFRIKLCCLVSIVDCC